ncbi:MAG: TlpA family protein disulfide reductase [Bacteroidales bacterium]|nr:TlpA family protein disulfide reductase [Bacteroidales bacterium]
MKRIPLLAAMLLAMALPLAAQNAKMPQNVPLKHVDGDAVQSSVIQNGGRPVIVSFWATWCKPCNRELDAIKEVYDDWQEETGVKLVAISIDDTRSAARVRPWVNGKDWPYEVYLDQNKDLARAMGVVDVPHTFLLNGDGEIVWQHTTYQDGSEEELIERVRQLLK